MGWRSVLMVRKSHAEETMEPCGFMIPKLEKLHVKSRSLEPVFSRLRGLKIAGTS